MLNSYYEILRKRTLIGPCLMPRSKSGTEMNLSMAHQDLRNEQILVDSFPTISKSYHGHVMLLSWKGKALICQRRQRLSWKKSLRMGPGQKMFQWRNMILLLLLINLHKMLH